MNTRSEGGQKIMVSRTHRSHSFIGNWGKTEKCVKQGRFRSVSQRISSTPSRSTIVVNLGTGHYIKVMSFHSELQFDLRKLSGDLWPNAIHEFLQHILLRCRDVVGVEFFMFSIGNVQRTVPEVICNCSALMGE